MSTNIENTLYQSVACPYCEQGQEVEVDEELQFIECKFCSSSRSAGDYQLLRHRIQGLSKGVSICLYTCILILTQVV